MAEADPNAMDEDEDQVSWSGAHPVVQRSEAEIDPSILIRKHEDILKEIDKIDTELKSEPSTLNAHDKVKVIFYDASEGPTLWVGTVNDVNDSSVTVDFSYMHRRDLPPLELNTPRTEYSSEGRIHHLCDLPHHRVLHRTEQDQLKLEEKDLPQLALWRLWNEYKENFTKLHRYFLERHRKWIVAIHPPRPSSLFGDNLLGFVKRDINRILEKHSKVKKQYKSHGLEIDLADQMADQMQIVMRQQQEAHEFHLSYDAYDRLEMQWNTTQLVVLGKPLGRDLLCTSSELRIFKNAMDLTCNNMWERFNDELNIGDILARTPTPLEQAPSPPPVSPQPRRRGAKPKFDVGERV